MRRRDQRRRMVAILLLGTLLVVGALGYLNSHPIQIGSSDEPVYGAPRTTAAESDVLVVIWSDGIEHAAETNDFDNVDWSWAWVDALESSLGPIRVIEPGELDSQALSGARFIVVTHSAALFPEIDRTLHLLEQFVAAGGVLVLERPEGGLRSAFSADGRGGMRTPAAISGAAGVSPDVVTALQELPLFSRFVGSTGPVARGETLLSMDGAPVVYRVRRAAGTVVTVDFNLGLAIVSLQQGRPGRGFHVEAKEGEDVPTTLDLVADPLLSAAEVPYADLLEHFIVFIAIGGSAPLVGAWPYPEGTDGLVVMTHNTEGTAERSLWMADYEANQDATSTFFLGYQSIPTEEDFLHYEGLRSGFAALWERGDESRTGNRRRVGVGGVRPFSRLVNLSDLFINHSSSMESESGVFGVRILDGVWSNEYAEPFQTMAAAGFTYDSTYGMRPADSVEPPVYQFGTGAAFAVLDRNGLPLSLFELPVAISDLASVEQTERLQQFLRRSQRSHHQVFTVHVGGDVFERTNALDAFDAWQRVVDSAGRRGHSVVSAEEYLRAELTRRSMKLSSRVRRTEDGRHAISIEVDTGGSDLWLRVPAEVAGMAFREARATRDETVLETREVRVFGLEQVLLRPPEGETQIEAVYR